MAEWIVCPNCNLHHSVRSTRVCPRCKLSIDGAAAPSALAASPEPPLPFDASAPPAVHRPTVPERPAQAGWTPAEAGGCANHPEVTTGLVSCRRCGRRFCSDCVVALRGAFFCADCKGEQVRDVQSGRPTSAQGFEGLELASVGRRFGALWLDGFITTIGVYAIIIPFGFLVGVYGESAGDTSDRQAVLGMVFFAITLAVGIGLPLVYEALMLSRRGQTLGKMALGIKVVTPEGGDISIGQGWGRAALKVALGCAAITYWSALFTAEKTTLHDLLAKTRVVRLQS
jgi:uncharacterized RDD family membrane protein YckC